MVVCDSSMLLEVATNYLWVLQFCCSFELSQMGVCDASQNQAQAVVLDGKPDGSLG